MKCRRHALIVLASVMILCGSPMVSADLVDGGFESGTTASWFGPTSSSGQVCGQNVAVVEYEYTTDSAGISQPPYTTGPDGTRAWRPSEGDYFLSIRTGTAQLEFFARPTGDPLCLSFDWFFDGADSAAATVDLLTGWGLMATNENWGRLIQVNGPLLPPAYEVYSLAGDENLGWSRLSFPLSELSSGGPPMDYGSPIRYVITVHVGGYSEAIFGIDNITLEPVSVVPLPGAFILGSLGLAFAGWRLQRCREP